MRRKFRTKKYKKGDAVDTGDFGSEAANDASLSAGNKSVGYGGGDGDPRTGGGVTTKNVTVNKGPKYVNTQPLGLFTPLTYRIGATTLNIAKKSMYNAKNLVKQKKIDVLGGEMLTTGKPKTKIGTGDGGGSNNLPILPIQATKPVDKELINPTDNFFNFKAYNVGGLSGGVSYGPPPKRGPNPQVPPVKMKRGGYKK